MLMERDRRSRAFAAPLPETTGRKPTPAFAQRRAVFGPVELREDRIRAESYLADDLSPAARRVLRDRDGGLV